MRPTPFNDEDRAALDWMPPGPLPWWHEGNASTAHQRAMVRAHVGGEHRESRSFDGRPWCYQCGMALDKIEADAALLASPSAPSASETPLPPTDTV